MKQVICCLCGVFAISTADANVYEGTYTKSITVTGSGIVEQNSVFDGASIYIKNATTLTVLDNVTFKGSGSGITGDWDFYTNMRSLNLDGDNIIFSGKNRAIIAGILTFDQPSSLSIGAFDIRINGNNIIFDGNYSKHNNSTDYGQGGAIYIGIPNGHYYSPGYGERQSLYINGSGTTFSNNSANSGGAIYSNRGKIIATKPVYFNSNSSSYDGGAIYLSNNNMYGSSAHLEIAAGSEFKNNVATNGKGGAIYNDGSNVRIGSDTVFDGNTAKNGGAIYNNGTKALIEIDTGVGTVYFKNTSDSIYNNGGTINFLGTGCIDASLTSLTSVRGDTGNTPVINLGRTSAVFDTVILQDNTTLKTTVWADGRDVRVGNISANKFNFQNNDELNLRISVENRNILSPDGSIVTILRDASGMQGQGWDYYGRSDKRPSVSTENNLLYDIEFISDGVYKITPKVNVEFDPAYDGKVMANIANAWNMAGFQTGSVAEKIADQLYVLSQFADTLTEYNHALTNLMPETANIINTTIANNTHNRLRFIIDRMTNNKTGFWANGGYRQIYNGDAYTGHTFGGMFGQDVVLLNGALTLGQAFGYSQTSIDAVNRDFNIQNNFDLSLYGIFTMPVDFYNLYISGIVGYGVYDITENKTVLGYGIDSEFDAYQTSAQANIGIKRGLWGIEGGYRYTSINQGAYTDSIGQRVFGMNTGLSNVLARLYLANNTGGFQWGAYIGGEFAIGVLNKYENISTAPNRQSYTYVINASTDSLFTVGANLGVGLTDRVSLSVAYDGLLGGDYSEHSGKLRFNYTW